MHAATLRQKQQGGTDVECWARKTGDELDIIPKLQNERIEYNTNRGTSPVGPAMTGLTFEISRINIFF